MKGPQWFSTLRDSAEFRRLWSAHLISSLGSGVTGLAIPLLAAVSLGASPTEVGVLTAVATVPHVLLSLVAGALVDRASARALLIVTDLGRAACLCVVPVLGLLGHLSMPVLYCVVFLVETQTVVNDMAASTAPPKLLPPGQLAAGNSAMTVNSSVSTIAGNGLGGALFQLTGAAVAVAIDAFSYLVSGCILFFLRAPSLVSARVSGRRGVWRDIKSGLAYVLNDRVLVALCLSSGIGAFAVAVRNASLVLALVRELHFSSALVGILAMLAGVGGVAGGMLTDWAASRLGFGRSIIVAIVTNAVALALLTAPLDVAPAFVVGLGQFLGGLCGTVYTVGQLTMRQLATPREMLGRVNAARRFLVYVALPLGGIAGGVGGAALGSRPMLLVAAAVMVLSVIPLVLGKITRVDGGDSMAVKA